MNKNPGLRVWVHGLCGLLLACGTASAGTNPVITPFDGNGVITWECTNVNVHHYNLEWAPDLSGAWLDSLNLGEIAPTNTTMSMPVPMFYRIKANIQSPIEKQLNDYLAGLSAEKKFMGSVGVYYHGTQILWRAYGPADREMGVSNDPSMIYKLCSCTKSLTATAVMILKERGLITNLTDRVVDYVDPADFTYDSSWTNITIQNLLIMSSGLTNFTRLPDYPTFKRLPATNVIDTIKRFNTAPLWFSPGTNTFDYCNSNYLLLGYLIEKLSGMSYAAFLQTNIFNVLGMTNSGYVGNSVIYGNFAPGYKLDSTTNFIRADYVDMTVPDAAGSLYTTLEDWYKFDRALYGTQLVTQASLNEMFTGATDASAFTGGLPLMYGYGWIMGAAGSLSFMGINNKLIMHTGEIDGYTCNILRIPDDDLCVMLLANQQDQTIGGVEFGVVTMYSMTMAGMVLGAAPGDFESIKAPGKDAPDLAEVARGIQRMVNMSGDK